MRCKNIYLIFFFRYSHSKCWSPACHFHSIATVDHRQCKFEEGQVRAGPGIFRIYRSWTIGVHGHCGKMLAESVAWRSESGTCLSFPFKKDHPTFLFFLRFTPSILFYMLCIFMYKNSYKLDSFL